MKALIVLFVAQFFLNVPARAQEIKQTWSRLYTVDQTTHRKVTDSEKVELLLSAFKLVANYGYPDYSENKISKTPILVWIHCPDNALRWNTFSMLHLGYKDKMIDNETMANYILRSVYLDLYCRYPSRIKNPSNEDVDSIITFLGLSTEFLATDMLMTNPTPFDYSIAIPPDALLIGTWIRDREPFYYKNDTGYHIKVQIFEVGDDYFYLEDTPGFSPQKMQLVAKDGKKTFQFIHGDASYIVVSLTGDAFLYNLFNELIYEFL
jgi:hypothetical protein